MTYNVFNGTLNPTQSINPIEDVTRAPIANPLNSAQLGGILYHFPKLHPGPCNSLDMRPRTDWHTEARDRISRRLRLTRNVTTEHPSDLLRNSRC